MTPLDGSPLAFAGLWSMWGGETLTCSMLTTAALGGLARVHDRMPLILPRRALAGLAGRRRRPGRAAAPDDPGRAGRHRGRRGPAGRRQRPQQRSRVDHAAGAGAALLASLFVTVESRWFGFADTE